MHLKDKKILFFAPKFFGYEKDVYEELLAQGAEVSFLPDRPSSNTFLKIIYRFLPSTLNWHSNYYYKKSINKFALKKYTHVFIQSGEAVTIALLDWIKNRNVDAKFIFYTYDSIKNKKGQIDKIKFCDASFSFDLDDCKKYTMKFRPLFFSEGFDLEPKALRKPIYDLSFVGTAHSDRFAIISKINSQLKSDFNLYLYLYIQSKWLYHLKKMLLPNFKESNITDFRFDALSKKEVQNIFFSSNVILDIEHPNQTGLTMRTFEALGSRKKMVTTNSEIRNYDFYTPLNIHIIERSNPLIPINFFKSDYVVVNNNIRDKYKLSSWVKDIFSEDC